MLNLEKSPTGDDLTDAAAGGTGLGRPSFGRACAVTGLAAHRAFQFHLFFHPLSGFFQGNLEVIAQIAAPGLARSSLTTASAKKFLKDSSGSAPASAASKDLAENIKGIVSACPTGSCPGREGRMAVPVVSGPFIGIPQNIIGFPQLLEFFFGRFVIRIAVRVVF